MKEVPKNIFIESFYNTDFSDLRAPQIVVYYNTLDFPNKYVARVFDACAEVPCGMDVTEIAKNNLQWALRAQICPKCSKRHKGFIPAATNHIVVKDTLKELRECIPPMFAMIPRRAEDEAQIVEVWI